MKWTRPILALGADDVFVEHTGEVVPLHELPDIMVTLPPMIVSGVEMYDKLMRVHSRYQSHPDWNLRVIPITTRKFVNGVHRANIGAFRVSYFGFRSRDKRAGNRFFHCVDIGTFKVPNGSSALDVFRTTDDLRVFCLAHGLTVPSGRGGMGAALLRQFRGDDRHRTPRFINAEGRRRLPGNHYALSVPRGTSVRRAYYLDQSGAHHQAALRITPPRRVIARGNHLQLELGTVKAWVLDPAHIRDLFTRHHGLFAVDVTPAHAPLNRRHLHPAFMHEPVRRVVYVHSNETAFLFAPGTVIHSVVAAWTDTQTTDYLARFAAFAQKELASEGGRPWLKAGLLSTYGALATRPTRHESYFARTAKDHHPIVPLPHGGNLYPFRRVRSTNEGEPWYVNTIHRGMIEAQTRMDVLAFARELDELHGLSILGVYADALIVADGQLPILPDGWRVETTLTDLHLRHPNAFTAREIVKLPGVTGDRRRAARRALVPAV